MMFPNMWAQRMQPVSFPQMGIQRPQMPVQAPIAQPGSMMRPAMPAMPMQGYPNPFMQHTAPMQFGMQGPQYGMPQGGQYGPPAQAPMQAQQPMQPMFNNNYRAMLGQQ